MYRFLKNQATQNELQAKSDDIVHSDGDGEVIMESDTDVTGQVLRTDNESGHGEGIASGSGNDGSTNNTVARSSSTSLFGFRHMLHYPIADRQKFLARRIYDTMRQSNRTSKYIARVCWKRDANFHAQLRTLIKARATTVLFKWFTIHDDHYHIVHDCTYSNGSCRCFNKFQFTGRVRHTVETQLLTLEDFELIVKYHFDGERGVEILEVGGIDISGLFDRPKSVQLKFNSTGETAYTGDVEVCTQESEILWNKSSGRGNQQPGGENDNQYDQNGPETSGKSRKRRSTNDQFSNQEKKNEQEKLEEMILSICKVPLHDFVTTDKFINSHWRFVNNLSTTFKNAISTVKLKFYQMRLSNYRVFYEGISEMPYWDTSNRNEFDEKYMSIEVSKRYLLKLLIAQYHSESINLQTGKVLDNDWKSAVYAYVKDLIMLLDKKRHKLNTDVYISPPNAGKTLFCDLLRDYFVNCGQMAHWNRNSSFPLQTCGFTRIIFWNEPNYESSVERNLLKLLGGDSYNAAIKNQMDVNISKTPFIVTANNDPFPRKPEFEYRCKYHYWKSVPFLIQVNGKKFHPLSFQYLIDECENYYEEDITGYTHTYAQQSTFDDNFLSQYKINNKITFMNSTDTDNSDSDTDEENIIEDNVID